MGRSGRLRIGLAVENGRWPAWVARVAGAITAEGLGSVRWIEAPASAVPAPAGVRWIRRLDRRLFHPRPDAWAGADPGTGGPVGEDEDLDLVIDFSLRSAPPRSAPPRSAPPRPAPPSSRARLGVWWFVWGEPASDPAGFWEVLGGQSTSSVVLWQDQAGVRRSVRARIETDRRSPRRNRNALAWAARSLLLRELRQAARDHRDGTSPVASDESVRETPPPGRGSPLAWLLAAHGWRFLRDRARHAWGDPRWSVYFRRDGGEWSFPQRFDGFERIPNPRHGYLADPFCVVRDGEHWVFCEELAGESGRGVISAVRIDPRGRPGRLRRVLDTGHHLSFPFLFRHQEEDFMLTECFARGTLPLFRCVRWPCEWEQVGSLLDGAGAVDPALVEIDGRWWLFVCQPSAQGLAPWSELHLYYSDAPTGPWEPHRGNPVKIDVASSRPAGALFRGEDGALFRPGQDCSKRYGYAVRLHRVEEISPTAYRERRVASLLPPADRGILATHTINRCDGMTVIDGLAASSRLAR